MDNAQNLQAVWQGLSKDKRGDGRGAIYAFVAPTTGVGTSYVSRTMALMAGAQMRGDKQVLIVDMDIQNNAQSNWFFTPQVQARYGRADGPFDASFGTVPFWRVTPSMVDDLGQNLTDSHFMSLHSLTGANIAFTRFQWERFKQGQNVHIQNSRAYWHKLREYFGAIFVDIPALDRTDIISSICPEADNTVLVSAPQDAKSRALGDAYSKITSLNGHCAGVIFNQTPSQSSSYGSGI